MEDLTDKMAGIPQALISTNTELMEKFINATEKMVKLTAEIEQASGKIASFLTNKEMMELIN